MLKLKREGVGHVQRAQEKEAVGVCQVLAGSRDKH